MKTCRVCGSSDMASRSALCKKHHREYVRQHYENNKQYYIDKAIRHKEENKRLVREAKNKPCQDCGKSFPYYVMDFDHREDKEFDIGNFVASGRKKILLEIAKCDVVCSNCHRERTAKRAGYQI